LSNEAFPLNPASSSRTDGVLLAEPTKEAAVTLPGQTGADGSAVGGGFSLPGQPSAQELKVPVASEVYGPFHRLESPSQTIDTARLQEISREIRGGASRNNHQVGKVTGHICDLSHSTSSPSPGVWYSITRYYVTIGTLMYMDNQQTVNAVFECRPRI
jgi:hypothetical protein